MSTKRDYYEVLGIERSAGDDDIRKAYRKLARQYHPDVNKAADAEARFKEVNEAYEVLSDREKRAGYDRYGHAGTQGGAGGFGAGGFGDFSTIFDEFFGGFGTRSSTRSRMAPRRGADLRVDVTLTFEEAVRGLAKELQITRQEPCARCQGSGAEPGTSPLRCPQCNGAGEVQRRQQSVFGTIVTSATCPRCNGAGEIVTTPCTECRGAKAVRTTRTLQVDIPAGVDDNTQIRLSNEGEPGFRGGPPGNLFVVLHVQPHALFERREQDIYLNLPINFVQASLGAEMEVPTLDGSVRLTIPAGTQHGHTFRMRGKGVPYIRQNNRGDQYVTVQVVMPQKLTERQRQLLRELGESLGTPDVNTPSKGLFDKLVDAITEAFQPTGCKKTGRGLP